MKKHQPLPLIALVLLLIFTAAGSARAARLTLVTLPSWVYYGVEQGEQLGWSVAGTGDVNADGYADFLVGAERGGDDRQGQVVLFLGGLHGPGAVPDWEELGEVKGSLFGSAVDGAGDIDGDGYDDILAGASYYMLDTGEAGEGAIYVYRGGEDGPAADPAWRFESNVKNASLGAAVAGAGDVNGDGYADIVAGLPGYEHDDVSNVGAAYAFFGSPDGFGDEADWLDIGGQAGAKFGSEVNAAGDVNGDGYHDVLVGAPLYDGTFIDTGIVYLYLGHADGLTNVPAWTYTGSQEGERLGTSAASAGDVNGDGCDDVIIGAPNFDQLSALNSGRALLFYGCQVDIYGLNSSPDWVYNHTQAGATFGIDVGGGGDTNGDGYAEVLVGAHQYDDEQSGEGAVFAFFGSPDGLAEEPGWQVEGNKNDTHFGFSVDSAGDTNGDGLSEALVGAPQYRIELLIKGAAFLYFGTTENSLTRYYLFIPFIRR